jgi:hypothetical protein
MKVNSEKIRKYILILVWFTILFAIWGGVYYFNVMTPLCNDDYGYSFTLYEPLVRVNSVTQIIRGLYNHYIYQGGRMLAHFLAQYMLMIGDDYFNIFNATMYVMLVIGIMLVSDTLHYIGTFRGIFYLILTHILLFLYIPAFGEAFLWLDGSCNYLWTTTLLVYTLYPFKCLLDNKIKNNRKYFLLLPLFLLAGATNENSGFAEAFIIFMCLVITKNERRKIPAWSIIGFILFLMGYMSVIIAPGNYRRQSVSESTSILTKIAKVTYRFIDNEYILIIFITILLFVIYELKVYIDKNIPIYILAVVISTYSMVIPNSQPARAFVYPSILLIIITLQLITLLQDAPCCHNIKKYIIVISGIVLLYFTTTTVNAVIDVKQVYSKNKEIIDEIILSKEEGRKIAIVEIPEIPLTKYAIRITLNDTDFYHKYYAMYYGIENIEIK